MDAVMDEYLWILVVGFIVAFVLAFGIGANDVANSFGTSVGSKVLTLKQACILASIFETLGAVLVGQKVSQTIQKGIVDLDIYMVQQDPAAGINGSVCAGNVTNCTEVPPRMIAEPQLMVGQLAALIGSALWLMIATFFKMPISATHSIVGAMLGFSLVNKGNNGISWATIGKIVGSWFASPILSGLMSMGLFYVVRRFILNTDNTLENGLKFLPVFYGFTILVNAFSVFYEGPEMLYFHILDWWMALVISVGLSFLTVAIVWFAIVPWQRRKINDRLAENNKTTWDGNVNGDITKTAANGLEMTPVAEGKESSAEANEDDPAAVPTEVPPGEHHHHNPAAIISSITDLAEHEHTKEWEQLNQSYNDKPEAVHLFSFLQILTAIFGAFAHGANDVSNATGPVIALWLIYRFGEVSGDTPIWILVYGGAGICIGLWVWGRRVIETVGEDLTKIVPSSGFTIEIGAATTVLIASNIGIPISTTHCKVGSIVGVGWLRSREAVDWKLFRNIGFAWGITVPASGLLSALFMYLIGLAL